jgi:Ca2+-binding RTX toxin-like protein
VIKKLLRPRVFMASLVLLVSLSAFTALSAANSVPVTHVGDSQRPITIADKAPPECASIASSLNSISVGGFWPWLYVYPGNTLILGTNAGENFGGWLITWGNGPNCFVTGGGNDTVIGSRGNDIILGGPGDDNIDGSAGIDICYGGGGNDTFSNCETIYQ